MRGFVRAPSGAGRVSMPFYDAFNPWRALADVARGRGRTLDVGRIDPWIPF